jgi:hypothetical protein
VVDDHADLQRQVAELGARTHDGDLAARLAALEAAMSVYVVEGAVLDRARFAEKRAEELRQNLHAVVLHNVEMATKLSIVERERDDALRGLQKDCCEAIASVADEPRCKHDDGRCRDCEIEAAHDSCAKPARFEPTLITFDGAPVTIIDHTTGLEWDARPTSEADKLNWQGAHDRIATMNTERFAGHTDWRVPTIDELFTLIDHSTHGPSTFEPFRACTLSNDYWSSSTYVGYPQDAWTVNFYNGDVNAFNKSNFNYVRAVRTVEVKP